MSCDVKDNKQKPKKTGDRNRRAIHYFKAMWSWNETADKTTNGIINLPGV
jgi:hypothetical protein